MPKKTKAGERPGVKAAAKRLRHKINEYYLDDCPPIHNDLWRYVSDLEMVAGAWLKDNPPKTKSR